MQTRSPHPTDTNPLSPAYGKVVSPHPIMPTPALTCVWEGGKPLRPYTPINASFWREMLNLRNCGWSIKSCDLQNTPGGTSWIALRPISSSPESMVLFSWVNPPNFPECERPSDEEQNIKITRFSFKTLFPLTGQESSWYVRYSLVFTLRTGFCLFVCLFGDVFFF